ncbi:hypothetical protein CHLRE_02g142166v5 [Chlamydomonas reinhardtii]|uniref:PAS domain-containing protein n=1 Tax=Chlamydomonas reinhardtii TaxID=3055 RepID=A0A2K3E4B9_CHLRE|nr:uncharacterized protein CHLRE_02g142166v5 [Chlamydomonas reinhardtii]PNW87648.1 hypothetical protein CHLRE_02g142166v5 [Chlamydomonas reinhardtii]
MERQSSFGSQGSGRSSATKIVDEANKHGDKGDNLNANNGFVVALFGALFTLAKEKISDSWKVAVLTVVVDFLLILAIMLNLEYPWAVDPTNPLFKIFYMIEIHKPLSAAGYKFYLVVFYLLSAMLYVCIAICVWVAWCFKNDSFPFLWPIKFVRVVASLFFGMFYIAALNIFLVILECAPDHGVWAQHIWHVQCFAMPHLVHLIVAVLSSITFAVAALLLVTADHELEPMSRSLLAAPHSMCELKAQLAKTVITVVDVLLWDYPRVQGVVFMMCCVSTFYFHIKQLPYYTSWVNSFRLCFFGVHAWVAIHLCVLVFSVDAELVKKGKLGYMVWDIKNYETAKAITDSMSYALPFVFFGSGLAAAMRLYYFFRVALKFQILQQQPNLYSKRVHRFADDKDVEVASRVARVWDEDGNTDPQLLDLAEVIIRAGMQQFPKSPYLHIVYANLLIECKQQLQSGWAQMEEARRLPLNLSYRFSIFTREQEHKQKAAVSSSGESATDLVSYVEFQRNWRMIQSYHKAALMAMREFWRLLLNDAVNLNSLTSAFRKIEKMESLADKTYKLVLERYPKAVKLLRSYANFLEMVKNDPWTAAQYNAEADKQEEALENAEQDLGGEDGLSMRNSAIVTINAQGIIQMANKHAIKIMGYAKGELDGKNISCLMPQPFSARHNGYLRNYVTTGKAKILDSVREVVALHRDRYVFPIKIMVTKSQGSGADATFMGLLKEVEADPNTIKAWLMPNGVTLCADQSFTDYAGWAPNDLIGKPFSNIAADPEAMAGLLERAVHSTEEELASGSVQADMLVTHKYAEDVPVTVRVDMGGTDDQRLLVLSITRRGETSPMIVFDHHGRALFANQALCSLLGTKPKDMRGRDMASLLPQPFGLLHHRWIKDAEGALTKPPPSSCRAGAVHSLLSANGVHVPVRMAISSRDMAGVSMHIVRAQRVSPEEAMDEQRLHITTDQHGHILSIHAAPHHAGGAAFSQPPPPPTLDGSAPAKPQVFGFPPEHLVGRKLYEAVDVFSEWHTEGHSVMHAVKALAQVSASKPGSAWRVGVLPHHVSVEVEKAAARVGRSNMADGIAEGHGHLSRQDSQHSVGPGAGGARDMTRSTTLLRTSMSKSRAAVMQVTGPEHTAEGTRYTIRLWRPELLTGVIELNERMTVLKADPVAGLIFGIPASSMSQQPLTRFLKLGPPGAMSMKSGLVGAALSVRSGAGGGGAVAGPRGSASGAATQLISMESLLGNKHVKGGMKGGKNAHKTGPRRVFEARHADGLPLQISFQAALKAGSATQRLVAAIKPLNLSLRGNVAVLAALMRGDDQIDQCTIDNEGHSPSLHRMRAANAVRLRANAETVQRRDKQAGAGTVKDKNTGKGGGVPRLALAKLASPDSVAGSTPSGMATAVAAGMASARTLGPGGSGKAAEEEAPPTHRTDGSALATARDVGLEFGQIPRVGENGGDSGGGDGDGGGSLGDGSSPSGSGQQDAAAKASSSLSGSGSRHISDDSAMGRSHPGKGSDRTPAGVAGHKVPLSKRFLTREWQDIVHVDPEQVPLPHDAEYEIEHHVGEDKDMNVSSSSSSDSDGSGSEAGDRVHGRNTGVAADTMTREEALQRKKTMAALEPGERVQYVRGVKRVKEWLASGYHFDRRDAEPEDEAAKSHPVRKVSSLRQRQKSRQLSKVLEEEPSSGLDGDGEVDDDPYDAGLNPDDQLMTLEELAEEMERQETLEEGEEEGGEGKGSEEDGEAGAGGGGGPLKGNAWMEVGGGAASRAATHGGRSDGGHSMGGPRTRRGPGVHTGTDVESGAGDGASTSTTNRTMNRGRRLKRLLKLLSGQKVVRGVTRLRLHVLVVIGLMLLVHAVCYLMLIILINKQKAFITEISAAGEAIDRSHFTSMYSRAIEAASRGEGFTAADIGGLAAHMDTETDRLEYLHQGMYLGFKGLRRSSSDRLNALWDDPMWPTTVYKDTKVPSYDHKNMTLWSLGNDYISAAREVAYYASASKLFMQQASYTGANMTQPSAPPPSLAASGLVAYNVTLPANRFWLFLRANVGESLHTAYVRVTNTLLILAQDNISNLKLLLLVLLVVEGCVVCLAAIGYVFYLLWKASRARAALFTVFLVIPQGQVKTLASRHITTNQADSDDDDDDTGGGGRGAGGGDDNASDGASVVSGAGGAGAASRRSFQSEPGNRRGVEPPPDGEKDKDTGGPTSGGRRAAIKFNENTETKHDGKSQTVMGRIKRAISGDVTAPIMDTASNATATRRFTTRKRLTHTTSDIKHLAWPFFAWGLLIMAIYLVSFLQFAGVEERLVDLKMFERSNAQASRAMYYATDLALEPDNATQTSLQQTLRQEAAWLDVVYSTTLYGGPTLDDGEAAADGAHDANTGSLFAKQLHATLLFEKKGCLRTSGDSCLKDSDPFYQVSRNAIDPMMRRLMRECTLLSLDDLADVNANSTRWQYVWRVARSDLHDGLHELLASYRSDALAAFTAQGTLHTVIFAVSWVLWAAYLYFLLRPYLQVSSTETKRVAELLSQLPAELDVEGMVEESWLVVADTQLDKSGMSVWDPRGHSVARLAVKSVVSIFSVVHMRRFSIAGGRLSHDRGDGASVRSAVSVGSAWHSIIAKARRSSIGGASVTSAVAAGKLGGGGGDSQDEDGDMGKGRSGGLGAAPQTSVHASSLFAPSSSKQLEATSGKAHSGQGSRRVVPTGGHASPEDSAMVGNGSGGRRSGSFDQQGGGVHKSAVKKNKVAPLGAAGTPSGVWQDEADAAAGALPSGAEPRSMLSMNDGGGSRPLSPLLDLPMSLIVPPVADTLGDGTVGGRRPVGEAGSRKRPAGDTADGEDRGGHGAGAAHEQEREPSPYHFNRVMDAARNNTVNWEDEPWTPHAARTRRNSIASTSAAAVAAAVAVSKAAAVEPAPVGGEVDEVASSAAAPLTKPHMSGLTSDSRRSSSAQQPQLALPPAPQLAAAQAATASTRERLASGVSSSGGSLTVSAAAPLVPAAAAAAAATTLAAAGLDSPVSGSRTASASAGMRVVDRRTSLDRAGSNTSTAAPLSRVGRGLSMDRGSRPISPAMVPQPQSQRMTSPDLLVQTATGGTSPAVGAQAVGASGVVGVVNRRTSLEAGLASSRPGSRLGTASGAAPSITLPPPPTFGSHASANGLGSRPLNTSASTSSTSPSPAAAKAPLTPAVESNVDAVTLMPAAEDPIRLMSDE